MRRMAWFLVLMLLVLPLSATAQTEVSVLAAASLTDALTEIGALYQQENPGVKLLFSFAGSGTLQMQIEQGAPADLAIFAASKQMDALQAQDLIATDTRVNLLENQVVLVVPKDAAGSLTFETIGEAPLIAIGEPGSVPAGAYAMDIFTTLGIADALTAEVGKLVMAKDVREVLTYVATGNVEAGIVYATDALTEQHVRIEAVAPAGSHTPVIYPAAVVGASTQQEAAQAFLDYLQGQEASAVFNAYGFTALPIVQK